VSSARLLAPVISIEGAPRDNHGLTEEIAALLDVPGAGGVDAALAEGAGVGYSAPLS